MTECEEIAEVMPAWPVTFDEALAIIRVRMPDEGATVQSNVAEALLARVPLRVRQLYAARCLPDADIQRHAAIATDNGPFNEHDSSFTTVCELVRRERGLPALHGDS